MCGRVHVVFMFFISGNFRILTADHSAYPGLLRILLRILVSILTQIKRKVTMLSLS